MLDIFFGFVVVVVETLLLAGGASRSSILGTVAMMIRDEGNMHLWKKDGMVVLMESLLLSVFPFL